MGEYLHVKKLEGPLKRSIGGIFRSIEQFIPGQDLTPVPYANRCELSKPQTELGTVI